MPSVKFWLNHDARTIVLSIAGGEHDVLCGAGAVLPAARQQHEPLDARRPRHLDQVAR